MRFMPGVARLLIGFIAPLAAVTVGCSGGPGPRPASGAPTDTRPCATNLTVEGNIWVGRAFRSFQEYPAAKKSEVFDRVAATVAAAGWQINMTNKEAGIIAASQQAAWGQGQAAPSRTSWSRTSRRLRTESRTSRTKKRTRGVAVS